MSWLLALHICCTTLGLAGLICAHVLLAVPSNGDAALFKRMAGLSLLSDRIFGPLLGVGILLGFVAMAVEHVPATATWLVLADVLVVLGIAFQAAVAVPWKLRIMRAEQVGNETRMARLIAAGFLVQFALLVFVMVVKPYA